MTGQAAPCCSSTKYVRWDTINYGWNSSELQLAFCDAALQVSVGAVGRTIGNLILVTHSMGNLIAAAAVANNVCRFPDDNNPTTAALSWVALGGPMLGSWTANFAIDQCKHEAKGGVIRDQLDAWDLCPIPEAIASLVHERSADADSTLKKNFAAARAVYAKYVTHAACGTSHDGLESPHNLLYQALEWIGQRNETTGNDGVVDFESCAAGLDESRFVPDYTSRFYKAAVNHGDLSFNGDDDPEDVARQPKKWFQCLL
ncbi:Aste57867_16902 [Aphanomyces stellatus]|uniref:Aste57867_16902 protein n=1 Tax=Aphanomyces stellatus TaxID=120398 RepID=A0A485L8E2_9STRA|nr:hypothetical protein As57867_016844 [Aphanomyces stellatus]VFT93665.1 Aste57867_16902 [Aphanomyces stellatus]